MSTPSTYSLSETPHGQRHRFHRILNLLPPYLPTNRQLFYTHFLHPFIGRRFFKLVADLFQKTVKYLPLSSLKSPPTFSTTESILRAILPAALPPFSVSSMGELYRFLPCSRQQTNPFFSRNLRLLETVALSSSHFHKARRPSAPRKRNKNRGRKYADF